MCSVMAEEVFICSAEVTTDEQGDLGQIIRQVETKLAECTEHSYLVRHGSRTFWVSSHILPPT